MKVQNNNTFLHRERLNERTPSLKVKQQSGLHGNMQSVGEIQHRFLKEKSLKQQNDLRPVSQWNNGKKEEFKERKTFTSVKSEEAVKSTAVKASV